MAAKRPESQSTEVAPTEADTGGGAPAAVVSDSVPAAPDSVDSPAASETGTVVAEPVAVETPVVAEPAAAEAPVAPVASAQQVVYVEAPKPFVKKGNRGFGILIAIVSAIIFAAAFAVAGAIANLINGQPTDFAVVGTLDFWAPVLMFAVGFILVVLVVNRAGWAAHVLGSIFVALVVFFGGTGVELLLHINTIPSNEVGQTFTSVLFSSTLIIAALLAREVSLWMGFAIAARGRKVKARNVDARVLYDQEIAAKRAEYEQANARNAGATAAATEPAAEATPETAEAAPTA
jgi:hypothetical protein